MDNKIKEKIINDWFSDNIEVAEFAISRIESRNPFAFIREKTTHSVVVKEDDLFCKIDDAISFLYDLKKRGYTSIKQYWSGYEENYFVAEKTEDETDNEMIGRFIKIISEECFVIEDEREKKEKKEKEIAELKRRLKELEK